MDIPCCWAISSSSLISISPHLKGVYALIKVLFYVSSEDAQVLEGVTLAHE